MQHISSLLRPRHSQHRPLLTAGCCSGPLHACWYCFCRELAPSLEGVTQQCSASPSCLQARLLDIHSQTRPLQQQRQGQQVVLAINRSDYMLDEPSSTLLQVGLLLAPCTAQHWLQQHSTAGHLSCSRPCLGLLCMMLALLRNGHAILLRWLNKASPHEDLCGCLIAGRMDSYMQQAVYAPRMTPATVQQPPCCMAAVSW